MIFGAQCTFFHGRKRKSLLRCFVSCLTKTNPKEITMQKLLNAYRKLPSPSNRVKLQNYLNKHMMAVCMASIEDIAFLRAHNFSI
jgi:hypothetical protein